MNCFNHAENLLRFVTEAHIVYRALQLLGVDEVNGEPHHHQLSTDDEVTQMMAGIAETIVDEAWLLPSLSDVKAVADCCLDEAMDMDNNSWCICGRGMQTDMV
jgi:hypothetical protein